MTVSAPDVRDSMAAASPIIAKPSLKSVAPGKRSKSARYPPQTRLGSRYASAVVPG